MMKKDKILNIKITSDLRDSFTKYAKTNSVSKTRLITDFINACVNGKDYKKR